MEGVKYVSFAESIVNSERLSKLKEILISPNSNVFSSSQERTVFYSLLCALNDEYTCLKYDFSENKYTSLSLLAWRARNLLEIGTWCRFCCDNKNNAAFFYKEAAKDALELEEKLEKWGKETNQPKEWLETIMANKQRIILEAQKRGINNLDSKYTTLYEAAKSCKYEKVYSLHNKMLSKYAHPTAYQMLSMHTHNEEENNANYFFSQGALYFQDGFCRLESYFQDVSKTVIAQ